MSKLTERRSQEPLPTSIGPRPAAEVYQKHPIPGQMSLAYMNPAAWLNRRSEINGAEHWRQDALADGCSCAHLESPCADHDKHHDLGSDPGYHGNFDS